MTSIEAGGIGYLVDHGRKVVWWCDVCRTIGDVDLGPIAAAKGPDFSLTNKRPPCRVAGCPGRVRFEDRTSMWPVFLVSIDHGHQAWWDYNAAERDRLEALGYRMFDGKWIRPHDKAPAGGNGGG